MHGNVGIAADRQLLLTDRDRPLAQPDLAIGQLQGRTVRDRSYYGLSNKMICMYAIVFLVGSIFAIKGMPTDNSKGDRNLQSLAVGFLSSGFSGLGLSLVRWHHNRTHRT